MKVFYTHTEFSSQFDMIVTVMKEAGVTGSELEKFRKVSEGIIPMEIVNHPHITVDITGVTIEVPEEFVLRYLKIVTKVTVRLVPLVMALKGLFKGMKNVLEDFKGEVDSIEKDYAKCVEEAAITRKSDEELTPQ